MSKFVQLTVSVKNTCTYHAKTLLSTVVVVVMYQSVY